MRANNRCKSQKRCSSATRNCQLTCLVFKPKQHVAKKRLWFEWLMFVWYLRRVPVLSVYLYTAAKNYGLQRGNAQRSFKYGVRKSLRMHLCIV